MPTSDRSPLSLRRILLAVLVAAVLGAPLAPQPAFALPPAPTVSGQVVDDLGAPVVGAIVRVDAADGGPVDPGLGTSSDGTGAFGLTLPPGDYRVTAEPPPGPTALVGSAPVIEHVDQNGASDPTITLALRVPNVHGQVQAPDGLGGFTAVPDAHVSAMADGQFGPPVGNAATDDIGVFAMFLDPDLSYHVSASPPFGVTALVRSADQPLVFSGGVATITLTLRVPNVSGAVLDSGGEPAVNARVEAVVLDTGGDPDYSAGPAGEAFTVTGGVYALALPAGARYLLTANPSEGSPDVNSADLVVDLTSVPAAVDVELRLRVPTVTGLVRASDHQTPVAHASVSARLADNEYGFPDAQTQSGDDGSFSLALDPGTYQVTADPPWGQPTSDVGSAAVTVVVDTEGVADVATFNLDLREPNVSGVVVDSHGEPVENARVQAMLPGEFGPGGFAGDDTTDAEGNFALLLEPGAVYELSADPPQGSSEVRSAVVIVDLTTSSEATGLELALRAANVGGRVLVPAPGTAVVDGARVQVRSGDHSFFTDAQTGPDGTYHLTVPGGTYVLTAEPPYGSSYGRSVPVNLVVASDGTVTSPASLDVRLTVANVSGTVFEPASDTPVPNARIEVRNQATNDFTDTFTDQNGGYRLNVPTGTYVMRAEPPWGSSGFGRSVEITVVVDNSGAVTSPGTPIDLHLTTPNVSGRVLRPAPSTIPVANARVQVRSQNFGFFTDGATNAQGGFSLNVPPGRYVVTAEPPPGSEYGRSTDVALEIADDGTVSAPEILDLHLSVPNLSGRVLEPGSDDPVANAHVQVRSANFGFMTDGSTGQDGRFRLNAPPGRYRLSAEPPFGSSEFGRSAEIDVVVGDDGTVTSPASLDIHLSTPNLEGTVFAPGGTAPVAGAQVQVRSFDYSFFSNTQTALDGTYHLSVPAGTYALFADPQWGVTEFGRSAEVTITVAADGTISPASPIGLVLSTPNLTGRVLVPAPGDSPVGNANVNIRSTDFTFFGHAQAGGDGTFAITAPPGRTYVVTAEAPPGSQYSRSTEMTITVDGNGVASPSNVSIRLTSPNVTGTVYEPEPGTSAVAGTRVQVRSVDHSFFTDAQTDGSGGFALNVPRGEYVLTAEAPGDSTFGRSQEEILVIGADGRPTRSMPLEVRLTTANVTGVVLGPGQSTTTFANAFVDVFSPDRSFQTNAMSSADGTFRLTLPPGTYRLTANPPGGSTDVARSAEMAITVNADGTTAPASPISVHLSTPNVSGVVLQPNPSTATVGNAHVSLHTFDWSVSTDAQTDSSGAFRVKLAPGDYVAVADPPYGETRFGRSSETTFTVAGDGSTAPLSLRLTTPNVSGTVYYPDGTAAANVPVNVRSDNFGFFTFGQSDSEGKFRVSVPDGSYRARAEAPFQSSYSASAEVAVTVVGGRLAEPATLSLTLTRPSITGRVYDPGDDPGPDDDTVVGMGFVNLHNADFTVQVGAPIRPDGRFSLGGVAPSDEPYIVDVSPSWDRSDLMRARLEVTVPDDTASWPVTLESTPGSGRVYFERTSNVILVSVLRGEVPITSGAEVHAFDQNGGFANARVADEDGNYALAVSPGTWHVTVRSTSPANPWVYTDPPQLVAVDGCEADPCPATPVTLRVVEAGARVTGSVVLPDGQTPAPFGSTFVDVRTPDGRGSGGPVGSGGTFDVSVPPGTYQVHVFSNDPRYGNPPAVSVTVADGASVATGPIRLSARDARLQGRVAFAAAPGTTGAAVAGARVFAFAPATGGFAEATTQSDGTYSLNVTAGQWQVGIFPTPADNWLYPGAPRPVAVASGETSGGHDFAVVASAASIRGQVLLPGGGIAKVDGYVFAAGASGGGSGAPVVDGTFSIPVVAGSYNVSVFLAPGTAFTGAAAVPVTVAADGSLSSPDPALDPASGRLSLRLERNDKHVTGRVVDAAGQPVVTGAVLVSATNATGLYVETRSDAGDGSYDLALGSGTWQLAFRVEGAPYVPAGLRDAAGQATAGNTVTLSSDVPAVVRDLVVAPAGATVTGEVRDSQGRPVAGAWVHVDSAPGAARPLNVGTATAADGTFTVNVPDGRYVVGADGGGNGELAPLAVAVTAGADGQDPDPLVLSFRAADASISGRVTYLGTGRAATVQAWSDGGGFASTTAGADGSYTLGLAGDDTWHVGASAPDPADSASALVSGSVPVWLAAGTARAGVELALAPLSVPTAITVSFDAAASQVIAIGADTADRSDDVTLTVPAGALATSGTVSLVVTAIATPNVTQGTRPVGLGYRFDAYTSDGQLIKTNFNRPIAITFSYDQAGLEALGLTPDDLVPSFWDPGTRTYRRITTAVVDTAGQTIRFTTEHFTDYVVAASATLPAAPAGVTATGGNGRATVSWAAPADNGGSSITGYTVTASPGGATASVGGSALTTTVSGLTNGVPYTFTVRAANEVGTGLPSVASVAVVPATVPGAPLGVTATAGDGRATVAWTAPVVTGGLPVTGYTVTASPGGRTVSVGASARSVAVTGLTNGTAYTFTVRARNSVGGGALSAPSAPVTPSAGIAVPPPGLRMVGADGGVFSFGDAGFHGSTGGVRLNQPIVGMAATPSGDGYWLVASDGGVFSFGDAGFHGSTGGVRLNRPIVGMAATPSGDGYWLVASDGGIFSFGDAAFHGSEGGRRLDQPVVGIASSLTGDGYWLVAADGGVFGHGDAGYHGSVPALGLSRPAAALVATPTGEGYWIVARDGGIFAFGDAPSLGSTDPLTLNGSLVGASR